MGHWPCFGAWRKGFKCRRKDEPTAVPDSSSAVGPNTNKELRLESPLSKDVSGAKTATTTFNYRQLATATNNFRSDSLIGEGGFGPVYKGKLEKTGQVIAVKMLNQTGLQGDKEFLVEILMLSLLRHPNLVNMIGYCAEGNQRLLVYEFMPLGSLEHHLHDLAPNIVPLDWNTRMKIAAGAAKGLDYLHSQADPPVIYRDLKSSNLLLGEGFHPKLSDFGLAKFVPDDKSHVSTRVMGTEGYCAPEYAVTGKLTKMSDIYSFGIVLFELITGQRALDSTRGRGKDILVHWARPMLKDRKDFLQLADPNLKGKFSEPVFCRAVEVASMCVRENPHSRPSSTDVVLALEYLTSQQNDANMDHGNGAKSGRGRRMPQSDGLVNESNVDSNECKGTLKGTCISEDKDLEREHAVAEAKMWGETWREKMRQNDEGIMPT